MNRKRRHLTIVGGGITGLTAAYYLQKGIARQSLSLDFTLLEASNRLGGKVQTDVHNGFVMEKGPDSFLARKVSAVELVKDLGMENQLVRNRTGQSYILHRNRLCPIPEGAVMGVPTRLLPFVRSSLFSPAGKVRAAFDLILPRSNMSGDQSVGHFFRRRLGNEAVDHLIEPLLSGIYAGDIDKLSLMSTFPQFYKLEKEHRSLILAMKQSRKLSTRKEKPKGQFLTLKTGLQSMVEAIESELPRQSVMKSVALQSIEKDGEGYRLHLSDGRHLHTDAVILAVPGPIASKVLKPPSASHTLADVAPTSVATVVLAYSKTSVRLEHEGTGFVVPRKENYTITACTWTHKKWPHTTPDGKALIRCYVGRAGDDSIVDQSDDAIITSVLHDLKRILDISGDPEFCRITRWKDAMPQYTVGHRSRVEKLKRHLDTHFPGIVLAGAAYEGIGIPDCIQQGKTAAEQTLRYVMAQ